MTVYRIGQNTRNLNALKFMLNITTYMIITENKNSSCTFLRDKLTFMLRLLLLSILIWNKITKCLNTVVPCFQPIMLLNQYLQDNNHKMAN